MTLAAIKDEIMLRESEEETFAINLDDGEMYKLNSTALKIFTFCKEGLTTDEAVQQLAKELAEPGQEAAIREDVEATVKQFGELGFLEE